MKPSREQEIDVAARTMWGEARGEGQVGMHAVGCVIQNRRDAAREYERHLKHAHYLYGNGSLTGVCRAPFQFSCWPTKKDTNKRAAIETVTDDDPEFEIALRIAQHVYDGDLEPIVGRSTHYLTHALYLSPECPKWAKKMRLYRVFGNHVFLEDPSDVWGVA
jgi:hypothetical protein